ncbi:MAG: hypothetical protein ABIT09_13530 [Croceibacterium sp.]
MHYSPDKPVKPFLITKDEHGQVRLTVRETRFNSQGYPWITERLVDGTFKNAAAARAHATEEYMAKAGEFATK